MLDLEDKINILKRNYSVVKDTRLILPYIYKTLNDNILTFLTEEAVLNPFSDNCDIFNELYDFLYKNEVIGLLTKQEAKTLYLLSKELQDLPEPIIEVGTHLGFSTIFLAKNKYIYAVDNQFNGQLKIVDGLFRDFFRYFYENHESISKNILDDDIKVDVCQRHWKIAGVTDNIKTICQDAIKAVDYLPEASMVFYDANHDYDMVDDLDAYFLKIVPGGILAIHDFNQRTHGVVGAVYDFYKRNKNVLEGPFLTDSLIWFKKIIKDLL